MSPDSALIARRSDLRRIFQHEPSSLRAMVEAVLTGKVGHELPTLDQACETLAVQHNATSAVPYVLLLFVLHFCKHKHMVHACITHVLFICKPFWTHGSC